MELGKVLGNSFKALRSGTLWVVFAAAGLAVVVPYVLVGAIMWGVASSLPLPGWLGTEFGGADVATMFIALYGTLILGGLLALPSTLASYGALIYASDRALAQTPFGFGEAWGVGLRRLLRLLGLEMVIGFIYGAAFMVGYVIFAVMAFGGLALGGEDAGPASFVGLCFGGLLFVVYFTVVVTVWWGVEGFASRYAVIGDQRFSQALSNGWQAFKARWKQALLFGLVVLAITFGYQTATQVITMPIMFFSMGDSLFTDAAAISEGEMLAGQMRSMLVIYPVMYALLAPLYLWMILAWTSFFRNVTGLDAPPAQPAYPTYAAPQQYAYPPAQPYQPAPEYQPAPAPAPGPPAPPAPLA